MKFVTIFAPKLHAAKFEEDYDEFTKFIHFLTDASKLEKYFNENPHALYHYKISIEDAIVQTIDIALDIYANLEACKDDLNAIFEPLKRFENEMVLHQMKLKASWIRIYALKVESEFYIITGGAIKQSLKMDGHPDTKKALRKLESVKTFLLQQGITDFNGFFELINE